MLEIFPASSLDNSVLTPVLVGLLIVWMFQETYGWNFSGLVVPGYLASVLVVQPITGLVICVEAVLTWGLVWLVSEAVSQRVWWSRLFGRDRFFALCLASVLVRLALEGGGLSLLEAWLGTSVSTTFHSMGLLVVPLAANALWRMGLTMGIPRLGVPILLTWLVVEQLLLPYTNLSLASFELTYEDVALDFVSSPRAYMLLLSGAWLGSLANLRFGWDFGGLIIPGLLAVCWLEPTRLVGTLGEALAIAVLIAVARRLPVLRTANLAGGRMLVLGFTLAYLLRFSLAWSMPSIGGGLQIHDLFGFGYLLSTLIALRIHLHGDPFRSTIPALITSFAAFVLTLVFSAAMIWLLPPPESPPLRSELTARQSSGLVRAAYAEGLEPTESAATWVEAGPGLRQAESGRGLLLDRGAGESLAVSATVGLPALGAAAQRLADGLDARFLHLCQSDGPDCDEVRAELGRRGPVLVVIGGEENVLRAGERANDLDLGTLASQTGTLRLVPTPQTLELMLEPASRYLLASSGAPLPLQPPRGGWPRLRGSDERPPPSLGDLRWLRQELAEPLAEWRRGESHAEEALAWAVTTASEAGLQLTRADARVELKGPELWLRADRRGEPGVIWVPYGEDPDILPVAAALARVERSAWLIADATPTLTHELYPRHREAFALLWGALGGAGDVVALRGTRDVYDPGAEVVLALARPVLRERPWPEVVSRVDRSLRQAGYEPLVYDGDAQRLSFLDAANPSRALARAASGFEAQATVWMSTHLRRDLGDARAGTPFTAVTRALSSEKVLFDLDDPSLRLSEPPPSWAADITNRFELLRSERVPTSTGELVAAVRAVDASMAVGCDPSTGCRWLVVERCSASSCEGMSYPLRRPRPGLVPPPVDPAARWLLDTSPLSFVRDVREESGS